MKFEDVPRLSKLPFILGDIALLLLAGLIATRHPHPFSQTLPLLIITGCFFVGIVATMIPFIVNNARDQEEAAAALRRELGEQFKRLMAASEHLQHATAQLKTIEEIATKNLQAAEKLPYRLQEKIAEFNQQLAETEDEEKQALEQELAMLRSTEGERLAAAADKIAKTTAEWTKLEVDTRKQLAAAAQLEQKLSGVLAAIDAKITALDLAMQAANRVSTVPPPAAESKPGAGPAPVVLSDTASTSPEPGSTEPSRRVEPAQPAEALAKADAPAAAPKPPRKPRAPKKPKPAEPAPMGPATETSAPAPAGPASAEPAASDLIAEPVADEPPAPENFSQVPPEEGRSTPTPSADGQTRLTVVSYIGIGNKLYLRGEGPGLSWDKGVPLQFVSIGRWRWETGDATAPVTCKVYKNDKIEAPLGPLTLAPGTEQEVTAAF
jgi:hypothetical protein